MDVENIPVIEENHLEKFVTQLCYRPNFSKRTIPGIVEDMEYDIDRMTDEIRTNGTTRIRKNLLYARIDGRKRMISDMQKILDHEMQPERSKNAPVPMKATLEAGLPNPYGSTR